jgi:hypothetical protein
MSGSIILGLLEVVLRVDDRLEERRKARELEVRLHERALRAELEAAEKRRRES